MKVCKAKANQQRSHQHAPQAQRKYKQSHYVDAEEQDDAAYGLYAIHDGGDCYCQSCPELCSNYDGSRHRRSDFGHQSSDLPEATRTGPSGSTSAIDREAQVVHW